MFCYRYGKTIGAGGVSFGVLSNTGFGLLGNEKSGKTTILRILSGSQVSYGGDAVIGDVRLSKKLSKYLSHISYCYQYPADTDALNVEDTLHLLMTVNGYKDPYRKQRINMFINALMLDEFRTFKVNKYMNIFCGYLLL